MVHFTSKRNHMYHDISSTLPQLFGKQVLRRLLVGEPPVVVLITGRRGLNDCINGESAEQLRSAPEYPVSFGSPASSPKRLLSIDCDLHMDGYSRYPDASERTFIDLPQSGLN